MKYPNFIIAGVARCGTTSLYHYLNQHPDISFSAIKEPKYFSSKNISFPHKGIADETVDSKVITDKSDYLNLFKHVKTETAIGEASSDYLYYHKYTVDAIFHELGDIPILISIRNPVERAYSAFNNLVRDNRENLTFSYALDKEDDRLADNWDWMWAYKKGGQYYEGLSHFKSKFSNVKVILFEDLAENPNKVLKETFKFLNVDPNVTINTATSYSHSGKPKHRAAQILADRNNKFIYNLRTAAIKILPRKYLENLASKMFEKKNMNTKDRIFLKEYFKKDILKTGELINKDLSHWLS
ncbi:MAG: sulfotransferase [Bacteroidota bacterium]